MKRLAILGLLALAGCTTVTTLPFHPVKSGCVEVEHVGVWTTAVAMPCFDDQGRMLGRQVASGISSTSPAGAVAAVAGGAANAAVVGAVLPKLLPSSTTTVTTGK